MKKVYTQFLLFVAIVLSYGFFFLYLFGYIEEKKRAVQPVQPVPLETGSSIPLTYQVPMGEYFPDTYGRKYPITDGKMYRIISVGKPCSTEPHPRNQEALEVMVEGKWKEVYRVEDRWSNGGCSFPDILIAEQTVQLSPLGDYVNFRIVGNEWTESELVNVKTKKQVLPEKTVTLGLLWSKDARNYAFISQFEAYHGSGQDVVSVSGYKKPDEAVSVFSLPQWVGGSGGVQWESYIIAELKFLDNQTIQFSVFDRDDNGQNKREVARYQYDFEKEKLREIFRK